MPVEWIAILAAAAIIIVATKVIVYTLSMARNWIRERIGSFRNRQIVTGAVKERLDNGDFKIVPFIFDSKIEKIVDATGVEAEILDYDLESAFGNKNVALIDYS